MRSTFAILKKKEWKKEKGKKILKVTIESDDEDSLDEFLEEFCFIANDEEEEIDEELQATFKDTYLDFINIRKINKIWSNVLQL